MYGEKQLFLIKNKILLKKVLGRGNLYGLPFTYKSYKLYSTKINVLPEVRNKTQKGWCLETLIWRCKTFVGTSWNNTWLSEKENRKLIYIKIQTQMSNWYKDCKVICKCSISLNRNPNICVNFLVSKLKVLFQQKTHITVPAWNLCQSMHYKVKYHMN